MQERCKQSLVSEDSHDDQGVSHIPHKVNPIFMAALKPDETTQASNKMCQIKIFCILPPIFDIFHKAVV